MSRPPPTIIHMLMNLEQVREGVCVYHSKYMKGCDCKFGVQVKNVGKSETGSGCPELYQVMNFLKHISPEEEKKILARMSLPPGATVMGVADDPPKRSRVNIPMSPIVPHRWRMTGPKPKGGR